MSVFPESPSPSVSQLSLRPRAEIRQGAAALTVVPLAAVIPVLPRVGVESLRVQAVDVQPAATQRRRVKTQQSNGEIVCSGRVHLGMVESCWTTECVHFPRTASGPHTALRMRSRCKSEPDQAAVHCTRRVRGPGAPHEVPHHPVEERRIPVGGRLRRGAVRRLQLGHDHAGGGEPRREAHVLRPAAKQPKCWSVGKGRMKKLGGRKGGGRGGGA